MDMQILLNHVGFDSRSVKRAIIRGAQADVEPKCDLDFRVVEVEHGGVRFVGKALYSGPVARWKEWVFWVLDFSALTDEGRFFVEIPRPAAPVLRSEPFEIGERLLERRTVPAVLNYFRSQHCAGVLDEADRNLGFFGDRADRVDVHGGWYDASGDKSKYLSHLSYANFMNPQQTPLVVWCLLEAGRLLLPPAADPAHSNMNASAGMPDAMVEEAVYGADFLVRMQDPAGYFYMTVFDGWSKDPKRREICAYRTQNGTKREDYQAAYRQGGGLAVAALARSSTAGKGGEYGRKHYLRAAERGFDHLEQHNTRYLDDGRENIIDEYCALLAATELYRATRIHRTADPHRFLNAARGRAEELTTSLCRDGRYCGWWRADKNGSRPFFHASDAGLPVICLLRYADVEPDKSLRRQALEAVRRSLEFELALTAEVPNPFGYARQYVCSPGQEKHTAFFFPHENESGYWWQGENARLASLSAAAAAAAVVFREDRRLRRRLETYALDQLNWILGCNPFDVCMLHGFGRNNPEYETGFPNAYGGICNGITAGINDERDIDFLPIPHAEQGEHRWRWSEQWIPHAAWYLLAACTSQRSASSRSAIPCA